MNVLTLVDRRESLNRYIKENIVKLTSESASKDVEKKIRKDFSEKHNLKSDARFSGKDVAEEVAKYIVRTQSLSKSDFISQIQKIPFIGSELGESQLDVVYDTYSKDNSLIISSEDLPKLSSEEYVRKIQEEFAEKAKNRVEKDNELVLYINSIIHRNFRGDQINIRLDITFFLMSQLQVLNR